MAKSSSTIEIDSTSYNFILSYLYKIYSNQIESKDLEVMEMITIPTSGNSISMKANFYFNKNLQLYYTHANGVIVKISWFYNNFYLTFKLHNIERDKHTIIETASIGYYQEYDDGDEYNNDAYDYFALAKKLISESFRYYLQGEKSFYYKSISNHFSMADIQIIEDFRLNREPIFLSKNLEFQTDKIKERLLANSNPFNILIYGENGTGKTQLAENIFKSNNLIKVKVTGNIVNLAGLYSFVKVFDNVLLFIDDIENILSDTNKDFIEQFWDIIKFFESNETNKIFLLLTTTIKTILEKASLQPNKINSIVKLKHISKEYYKSLIERETESKTIQNCFSEEIINKMSEMNLSAPFIINFVNHLKTEEELNEELNPSKAEEILLMLYDSYY